MSAARFSIVMPAYNAEPFIHAAIRSISMAAGLEYLDQICVVDDGSSDATFLAAEHALAEFKLPGVVTRTPAKHGASRARARAIDLVDSPLVMCVDADDLVLSDRFVDALRAFEDSRVQLVGGDLMPFDDPLGGPRLGAHRRVHLPTVGTDIAATLLFTCPIWSGVSAFRLGVHDALRPPNVAIGQDWLFAHQVIQAFGPQAVANTGTLMINHRRSSRQVTSTFKPDSSDFHPVWAEILSDALGLSATPADLALHAKYSPYHFKPMPTPTPEDMEHWFRWTSKLLDAALEVGYVPFAVSRRIHQINEMLMMTALYEEAKVTA